MSEELIITFSYYGIGGAQRRAFALADNFAKNGYDVYVAAVLGSDSTVTESNYYSVDERIKLVLIPDYYKAHKNDKCVVEFEKKTKKQIAFLKKLQLILQPFKKLIKIINYRIDGLRKRNSMRAFMLSHQGATVISFGFNIYDYVYFATKGLDCKIVYAETNASNKYSSDKFFEQTKKQIKKSSALIFQTAEEQVDHGIISSKKAFVINNPVKSDLPKPFYGKRNKTIVNFCRLSRQKNLLLLIKAFEKLHREFSDYKLKLYADTADPNNAEYKNELITYIKKNGLEDCVFILPPSQDIHNIIITSAMFVSSSDYEGISNSMIEAMAIGLPCICTDCGGGGAREMITDGENGLLVPVGNAEALKNAMVRMITEEGLAEKCGRNAAEIRETHSAEKISEKWIEVIENIQTEN